MTAYQQLEVTTTAPVEDVWREFSGELRRFILRRVANPEDADDILQLVALRLVQHSAEPRDRRTLLAWLYTVTRNKIYNFLSAQRHRPRGTGDTDAHERLDATPAREENGGPDAEWEKEYQRGLSNRAMERVRHEFQPATWQAFWETAAEGKPAADVGAGLRMTPGAVYVAKSRVLSRLRDEVKKLMDDEDN